MRINKITLIVLLSFYSFVNVFSQNSTLENDTWKLTIRKNGAIKSLKFKKSNNEVLFNNNNFEGPSWYLQKDDKEIIPTLTHSAQNKYTSIYEDLELSITYKDDQGKLLLLTTIKNNGHTPFQPTKLGLKLGIDTYMDKYPDWESRLFPTLLRSEKTHFWGYFMSPIGKILVIASPDAIASWSHEYSKGWGTPPYQYGGHRITSVNLDLINALPLPKRHPQNMWEVKPGELKAFRIYLDEVENLNQVGEKVSELTQASTIDLKVTSCVKDEKLNFSIYSEEDCTVKIVSPKGIASLRTPLSKKNNSTFYDVNDTKEEGLYTIISETKTGKISEATFYVRKPYSWYMQNAMQAVIDYPQKASKSHCESWYGFYTAFAGGKYFRENKNVAIADMQFSEIFPSVFDTINYEPIAAKHRIQNVSMMIGILVDRHQLYNEEEDLQKAINLSKFLLKAQTPDGAYRARKIHYTSVGYIAKSLMELLEVLAPLRENTEYDKHYQKIYASVKLAIDELERNKANIETEGQLTFEDGMISCSALQLGQFALLQKDKKDRERYAKASLYMLEQHDCLEQLLIPDTRMRSATLRFWEAQYDVLMNNNFFNSPHGWSSWTTYANYYAYLLTGESKYLTRMFNGLNAAMQMIDLKTKKLSWALAVNPYLNITQICNNIDGATPLDYEGVHYHANKYENKNFVIGEQYVDMISDWFFANANDNDVHEHFKCLEEVALGKAYVAEKENGEILTFNCKATIQNNKITVVPDEDIIKRVHINLKSNFTVKVQFASKTIIQKVNGQSKWLSLDK